MSSGGREQKKEAGGAKDGGGEDVEARGVDPRKALAMRRISEARAYNAAHPDQLADFDRLTGGVASKGIRAIMAWQSEHGLKADGKVGPATLNAAASAQGGGTDEKAASEAAGGGQEKKEPGADAGGQGTANGRHAGAGGHHGKPKAQTITFGEDEGSTVEGDSDTSVGGEVHGNPNLMDNITGGAVGSEKRETKTSGERLEEAGGGIQDAGEGLHHMAGMEESPWFTAAMAPAIVQLLREGDYFGAVKAMAESFSPSEYIEGLTMAAEKLGLHSAVKVLGKLAAVGAELDVSLELIMWTYEGLMAIAEAHEAGDRDSRITIYASAFADAFLYGEKAAHNAGAVTEEQKEAAERGRRDGMATAGSTGELAPAIGKELLRRYGGEKNARQAIIDALLAKAGIGGIKTHEGK